MTNNPHLTVPLSAPNMGELQEAILTLAHSLPDPDLIAAIRIDDDAHCAELDIAARPVDPRRLH